MKSKSISRILSGIGILLLVAPFYDHCNIKEERAEEVVMVTDSVISDLTVPKKKDNEFVESMPETSSDKKSFFEKTYSLIDDCSSHNAFEMAQIGYSIIPGIFKSVAKFDETLVEIEKDSKNGRLWKDFKGLCFYFRNLCFAAIVPLTFLLLPISFSRRLKLAYKLQFVNSSILLISIVLLMIDYTFDEWSQIKWGYHTFTIVQLMLLYFTRKFSKK